jgi:hypothetical protein
VISRAGAVALLGRRRCPGRTVIFCGSTNQEFGGHDVEEQRQRHMERNPQGW